MFLLYYALVILSADRNFELVFALLISKLKKSKNALVKAILLKISFLHLLSLRYPRTVTERGHSVLSAKSLGDNRVAVRTMTNLKTIRVWNADTLQEEFVFDHQADVLDFDVSPDGERIVSCDVEGNATCWSVLERVGSSLLL